MAEQSINRMATASSWNPDSRTAEVVLSTDADVGDGVVLEHSRKAIRWPERPVPVVLDHNRSVDAVAGAVVDLKLQPLNGRTALVGRLQLDGPAADRAEPLLRTGAARWSIGARIHQLQRQPGTDLARATDWSPGHLALVVEGQDLAAITRAADNVQSLDSVMTTETNTPATATQDVERSAKAIRRERDILRVAAAAGVTDQQQIDRWIDSDMTTQEVSVEAVRAMRIRLEGGDVRTGEVPAIGHPARVYASPATHHDLGQVLAAKMGASGEGIDRGLAQVPMHLVLRDYLANDPDCRGIDLARSPITRLVDRAFSTSDFKTALESSADRMLLAGYAEAQTGVLELATSRDLPDFRAMEMLRVSQYGEIHEKLEGGEYKTSTFSEEDAATLQAAEYGAIQVLTRKAIANDNLNIFGQMVAEMGRAAARKERSELAARLLNDFTWGTGNSETTSSNDAEGIIAGITAATLKLRRQSDVDGNPVSFEPRLLLVAPEQEAVARQALGSYNPTTAADVNPFTTLRIAVDHYLGGGEFYLADTNYPQLVIGRIGGGPLTAQEQDFKTGNEQFRVQLDFGTAVLDQRSIVKVEISEPEV